MDKKIDVKEQFDRLFSEKPDIQYEFDLKKVSPKDRAIINTLTSFNIEGKKCLDIGPGTGRWLQFVTRWNPAYVGAVDISDVSLKRCQPLCDQTQKANFETETLNFESDFFDVVVSFEVLEHLKDPHLYLSEIKRVTKKGGVILMSLPNIASFISRVRLLFGILPVAIHSDPTHVSFYHQRDIRKLFGSYGLTPHFIPTSISLNPTTPKAKLRIPSNGLLSSFDDSLLFFIRK